MAKLIRSDRFRGMIFLSFPAAYFIFSSIFSPYLVPQYQFPLFPFVALAGAAAQAGIIKSRVKWVRLTGWGIMLLSTGFFLSDLKYSHLNEISRPFREAGRWVENNIPRDSRVLTYWWVYPPTDHFGFARESNYLKAGDLSTKELEEVNPEWVVMVDSQVFHDPRYAPVFGGYEKLVQGLRGGDFKDYEIKAQFSPDPWWEKVAGYLYREYSGFRILVYQKVAGK